MENLLFMCIWMIPVDGNDNGFGFYVVGMRFFVEIQNILFYDVCYFIVLSEKQSFLKMWEWKIEWKTQEQFGGVGYFRPNQNCYLNILAKLYCSVKLLNDWEVGLCN